MAIFVRVAEAGSFAAVADEMQVSRSAVTRHVAALEQHLGTKLMTRSTRSLSLTPAGASYLEKCRAILSLVDAAVVCSTTPARELGLQGFGTIAAGSTADLVVLDRELRVAQTYVGGELAWSGG